jgi:hypothetical protein
VWDKNYVSPAARRTGENPFTETALEMSQTRVLTLFALVGCSMALVRCGGSNSETPSIPASQDGGVSDATVADGTADGGETGSDAGTSSSGDSGDAGLVLDAMEEAGASEGGADAGDSGGKTDAEGGGDAAAGDGSIVDGAAVEEAGDAAPPVLVCNHQVCAPAEFCGAGIDDAGDGEAGASSPECKAAVFGNVCDNPTATLVFDTYAADNGAATTIGAALANACHMTIESAAADAGPVNADSGEPTAGIGNLCVIGGGAFGQPAVSYLDMGSLTDVYLRAAENDAGVLDLVFTDRTHPNAPVDLATLPYSATPTNTDYFLVQLVVDPASGSVCLDVLGMSGQGTTAGGYYVANDFFANNAYASSTKSWYLYYWVGASDAGVPSSSDTFTLVASGP